MMDTFGIRIVYNDETEDWYDPICDFVDEGEFISFFGGGWVRIISKAGISHYNFYKVD